MRATPSPLFGFFKALTLWRVVGVVFLASVLVFLPVRIVLWTTVGGALTNLPDGDLAEGETALVLIELLRPVWPSLALAFLSGCFTLWAWTVLWHAGLVRWFFYSGRDDVRLAEVLSRGLFGWWRWARLGLTSVAVLALLQSGIVAAYLVLQERAADLADDSRLGIYLGTGILLAFGSASLVWLATLRGAWSLGESQRRSAVLAWFAGLWGVIFQPLRSLATLLMWVVPAVAAAVFPTILAWRFEILRDTAPSAGISIIAGLVMAFCQVGLFLSFAPETGLAVEKRED